MMTNYRQDFGPFEDRIWLNCAGEGPMPRVAVDALQEAVQWKVKPYHLTHKRFQEVPQRLKIVIAKLLNVSDDDVILGNSATYGIHLLANGIPLQSGEEVVLMQNDFPVNILPWLALKNAGVVVRQIPSAHAVIQPDELFEKITPRTRVVCLSHVHSFSGHIIDIETIGTYCRQHNIIFIVNFSQAAGCRPIDLSRLPVDAMTTAGFKWLCGPYGTGFCWMTPQLRKTLQFNHAYWVNILPRRQWEETGEIQMPVNTGAARYDVFGTANFFNFVTLAASMEYLMNIGLETIQEYNNDRVSRLLNGMDENKYDVISPQEPQKRSSLFVFSSKDRNKNKRIFQALIEQGIYMAMWKGNMRISPHIYNTEKDIDNVLTALHEVS